MNRPYKPIAFANEFIKRSQTHGVSHMKLQKLVYCAYGWWLAYHNEPILSEKPQVWRHGPVFKSLYFALKHHGWHEIKTIQNDNFTTPSPSIDEDDAQVHGLLDWVWERYQNMSAEALSDLTHKKGSPWEQTVRDNQNQIQRDTEIPIATIIEHFRGLVNEYGLDGVGT